MGLDTSHDCWHGAYSAFMTWREKISEVCGLPPLRLMEGFYGGLGSPKTDYESVNNLLPIKWDCIKISRPLYVLLSHSDCEGKIDAKDCGPMADELEKLIPIFASLPDQGGHIGNWQHKTQKFIDGLRLAYSQGEDVDFH